MLVDRPRAESGARTAAAVELLLGPQAVAVYAALAGFTADGPLAGREPAVLAREAARALRTVRRRARRVRAGDLDGLHRVRTAAKRARMGVEELVAAGLLPPRMRRVARRAQRVQDRLGEHRDLALLLRSLPARSTDLTGAGGNAYALGLVAAHGERLLRRHERTARRAMRRLLH